VSFFIAFVGFDLDDEDDGDSFRSIGDGRLRRTRCDGDGDNAGDATRCCWTERRTVVVVDSRESLRAFCVGGGEITPRFRRGCVPVVCEPSWRFVWKYNSTQLHGKTF
jgi:hypothetical protein